MNSAARTILVVADAVPDPDLNTAFLCQPHVRVLSCAHGAAIDLARRERPDLAVVDVGEAAETALAPCRVLRADAAARGGGLILVAAAGGALEAARGVGSDLLLEKPFSPREFFEAVRHWVPLPERRHARYAINLRFSFEFEGRALQAFSRNVSLDGAFLKTDRRLPTGRRFPIVFALPGDDYEVHCCAVVRQTAAEHGCRGVGLEFEGIGDPDLERLEAFFGRLARP